MQTTKHEYAKVVSNTIISMDTPADLANASHLSHDLAEKIETITLKRAAKRGSSRLDVVIVIEPWAMGYPSRSDPIAKDSVLLVGEIVEHSEKAYKCRGAVWVDTKALEGMTIHEVEDADSGDFLSHPREYETNPLLKFLPKSAVECIAVLD